MSEIKITVPLLDWLIGGSRIGSDYNRYFGSVGTDPLKGFIGQKVFNYSIWIEKITDESEEEKEVIRACFWIGENSIKNTPKEDVTERTFDLSDESREEIKKWLTENAEAALK